MVETSSSSSNFNQFIEDIYRIPELTDSSSRIAQLIESSFEVYQKFDQRSDFHFEIASQYLTAFLEKFEREQKQNRDIAEAVCQEALDTVNNYVNSLKRMAALIPKNCLKSSLSPHSTVQALAGKENRAVLTDLKEEKKNEYENRQKPRIQTLLKEKEKEKVQKPILQAPSRPYLMPKFQPLQKVLPKLQCTVDIHGLAYTPQKAYYCKTCDLAGTNMLCEGCTKKCHAGHDVVYRGVIEEFCDCRFMTTLCSLQKACTLKYSGPNHIPHQIFICETCGTDSINGEMMCQYCANTCHKNHKVRNVGWTEQGYCDCKELYSFCCMNKE